MRHRVGMRLAAAIVLMFSIAMLYPFHRSYTQEADNRLVLVEDGGNPAPIVLFEDAPRFTRHAAKELADYIEKVSGARPDMIHGKPDPVPDRAIWVGVQPTVTELFPDIDFDFEHPEEILIAANPNHLVIAGRDRWDPEHLNLRSRDWHPYGHGTIKGFQQEYGTCNAVYTFLQTYLDVRWLWPGELGEDIIKQQTIAFSPFQYRHHPQMRHRHSMLFSELYRFAKIGKPQSDWTRRQRVQLDSLKARVGGHGFGAWFDRYHEQHPEYFALQPDGTRNGFPKPRVAKMCESNPVLWEQWIAEIRRELETVPFRKVYSAAANDSSYSGHCICPDCRAWDHPDARKMWFRWEGVGQEYLALSDRQVIFANQLSRLLKTAFPERKMYVSILAYGNSRPAPVEAVAEDRVIVGLVQNFFQRSWSGDMKADIFRQDYKEWAKVAENIVWRPNVGSPARWRQGGPTDITGAIEDFRLLKETGCIGMHTDHVYTCWLTQGPLYYLMAQLAYDLDQDGREVMDEYYRRAFGPAAEQVRAFWNLMEKARNKVEKPRDGSWEDGFDDKLFQQADALLDKAENHLRDEPEKYIKRLEFVRAASDFLRLTTENLKLVQRLDESDGQDKDAYAKATDNWDKIEAIAEKYPIGLNIRNPAKGHLKDIYPENYAE